MLAWMDRLAVGHRVDIALDAETVHGAAGGGECFL